MRRALKIAGIVLGVVVVAAGGMALFIHLRGIPSYDVPKLDLQVERTPARIAQGRRFGKLLCQGCHLSTVTRALTGKRMEDAPPVFGEIVSKNITQHPVAGIGQWTDGELAVLMRTGLRKDGQYLPPYMPKWPHLSDEDVASVIAWLRSDDPLVASNPTAPPGATKPSFLTKFLTTFVFKPLPMPKGPIVAPPKTDLVAYGKYLAYGLDCYGCHAPDFKKVKVEEPERTPGYMGGGNTMIDLQGKEIRTSNITSDPETGIGKWSEADFIRAMREGVRPDGALNRYPMLPMPELREDEVRALFAYLKSIPPIKNAVPRPPPAEPTSQDPGAVAYAKHGCVSCHGPEGSGGLADLRAAVRDANDIALKKLVLEARSVREGAKMPTFAGRIPEHDLAPLFAHLRKLAAAK